MIDLTTYIQAYFRDFSRISKLESYKWGAYSHYAETSTRTFNSLRDRIETIYGKTGNLLTSFRYYPLAVLLDMAGDDGMPGELCRLLDDLLLNGKRPTSDSIRNFMDGAKGIMTKMADSGFRDWKGRTNLQSYQDAHAISVYLSLHYPDRFYIYKYGVFKVFSSIVGYSIKTVDSIDRLFEFQELCNCVRAEIQKNVQLVDFYRIWLNDHNYSDDNLNLLTQDFIYAVVNYLNSNAYKKIENRKTRVKSFTRITAEQLKSKVSNGKDYSFKGIKGVDYGVLQSNNSDLGFSGEMWAVNFEKERLMELGISSEKVRHTSLLDGDGCGYDIESVEEDGITPRFIEVKTTSAGMATPFYFSNNELQFSREHQKNYHIYRVFNFVSANKPADLLVIDASLDEISSEPVSFRAQIKL